MNEKSGVVEIDRIEAEENFVIDFQFLLQEVMNERGLNRTKVAQMAGISAARLTQLMRDDANPTIRSMVNIFHALGERIQPVRKACARKQLSAAQTENFMKASWSSIKAERRSRPAQRRHSSLFSSLLEAEILASQNAVNLRQEGFVPSPSNDNPAMDYMHHELATG